MQKLTRKLHDCVYYIDEFFLVNEHSLNVDKNNMYDNFCKCRGNLIANVVLRDNRPYYLRTNLSRM